MNFGLPKFPKLAGTAKEFRDWDLKLKKEYPIRYQIREAIKLFFRPFRRARWYLKEVCWWAQYRVNPKHKYTTIKLKKLKPGYYDADDLIFYSMFEIFEDFMKRQLTNPHHVWEYNESHFPEWMDRYEVEKEIASRNAIWEEMKEIYDWWVNVYPNRESTLPKYPELPEEWGSMAVLNEDFDDTKEMGEWKKVNHIRAKMEMGWREEDIGMMVRLVKINSSLWD